MLNYFWMMKHDQIDIYKTSLLGIQLADGEENRKHCEIYEVLCIASNTHQSSMSGQSSICKSSKTRKDDENVSERLNQAKIGC